MRIIRVLFVLVLLSSTILAQEKPAVGPGPSRTITPDDTTAVEAAPALTDLAKLRILNAAKDVEIWTLKAQQAAAEVEKARLLLQRVLATETPDGYQINDKLELVKTPEPKK